MKSRSLIVILVISSSVLSQGIYKNEFEQNLSARISTIELVDPHAFAQIFGCNDVTSYANDSIQSSVDNDGDGDGNLDESIIIQFASDQPDYLTTRNLIASLWRADCPDPLHSAACMPIPDFIPEITSTTFSTSGICLEPLPGTNSPANYNPAPNITAFPCYATEPIDVNLSFGVGVFPLSGYQRAEKYQGGLTLTEGLMKGFISQADAAQIEFTAVVGGITYSNTLDNMFAGDPDNCKTSEYSDMDIGPDGITQGWWLYFNITSELVEFNN